MGDARGAVILPNHARVGLVLRAPFLRSPVEIVDILNDLGVTAASAFDPGDEPPTMPPGAKLGVFVQPPDKLVWAEGDWDHDAMDAREDQIEFEIARVLPLAKLIDAPRPKPMSVPVGAIVGALGLGAALAVAWAYARRA